MEPFVRAPRPLPSAGERPLAGPEDPLAMLDAIPSPLLLVNRHGAVAGANTAAAVLFGTTPDRVSGQGLATLLHPASVGALCGWAEAALVHGEFRAEVRCRHTDGSCFEAEVRAAPLPGAAGGWVYAVALADVSEHRRLQRELAHCERLASMSRFVAGVAAELNNPLQVILGNTERLLAADATAGPTQQGLLEGTRDYANRAAEIVRSLLLFASPRTCSPTLVFPHVVLDVVVSRREEDFAREGIAVQRDWDGTATVLADGPMLEEVCAHLVANAEEAMRPTGGDLSVAVQRQARRVLITIGDTGPGIAPALRARVFDPFFTTKAPGHGTGLGLSICQGIIAEHGGTLTTGDAPRGALLVIDLPAAPLSGVDPFQVQ